jgi:ABC-2 type transport system permease protein
MIGGAQRGWALPGWAMRLRGLLRKEIKHVLRDPSAIMIAFLMPVVLLLVNGYGISLDAYHLPVAVVIEAPDEIARGVLQAMDASPYL